MKELLIVACLCFISACTTANTEPKTGNDHILVNSHWVAENLNRPDIRILELGNNRGSYDQGHIPNAQYVDWLEIIDPDDKERFNLIPKEGMARLLGKLGITPSDTIVLYDTLDARLSMRLFWSLYYYGHTDIKVLDGNKNAWINAAMELTKEVPDFNQTRYPIRTIRHHAKTDLDFIMEHLDHDRLGIIDGRPSGQYSGEFAGVVFHTKVPHKRKGHIKGAVNAFWKNNFNEDGTFKNTTALREYYRGKGITEDKIIVTYCNEGLHATPAWFVLTQLLGYENVHVYDDSMAEWANRDDTPMETGR